MRLTPVNTVLAKLLNFYTADAEQKHQLGTPVDFASYDYSTTTSVPNAGGGRAVYVKAAGSFATGRLVHVDKDWTLLDMPNTANTGRPLYVALSNFSASAPYGWVARAGIVPVSFSVAATAGPIYFAAAGQATPSATAGKQILNASTLIAATGNFTKSVKPLNGSPWISILNGDVTGLYPGMAISGTGISGTISEIGSDGRSFKASANSTASGAITATFTHTGFGIVHIENPFVQGQIT